MVAQSLEQDSSWSLESSQGWLQLVGQETSLGQHHTKATLEAFLLPGGTPERGNPGQCSCTHTSPSLHLPNPAPFLLPAGPQVVLLPLAGTSHPGPHGTAIPVPALPISAAALS